MKNKNGLKLKVGQKVRLEENKVTEIFLGSHVGYIAELQPEGFIDHMKGMLVTYEGNSAWVYLDDAVEIIEEEDEEESRTVLDGLKEGQLVRISCSWSIRVLGTDIVSLVKIAPRYSRSGIEYLNWENGVIVKNDRGEQAWTHVWEVEEILEEVE